MATRRSNRSTKSTAKYTDDVELEDDHDDFQAGKEAEDSSDEELVAAKRKAPPMTKSKKTSKKARKGRLKQYLSAFELPVLNEDILNNILDMCSPRELLNFASTSKQFMERVTYTHVIHSCAIADVKLKNSPIREKIERVINQVNSRYHAEYMPSPIRMLRLALGKYCERPGCKNSCRKPQSATVHVCKECHAILYPGKLHREMLCPFVTRSGEKAGQIHNHMAVFNVMWKDGVDDIAHQDTLEYLDSLQPSEEETKMLQAIFDGAGERLERDKKAHELAMQIRAAERLNEQKARAEKILGHIKCLREVLDRMSGSKEAEVDALAYKWENTHVGYPRFQIAFVDEELQPYLRNGGRKMANKTAVTASMEKVTKGMHALSVKSLLGNGTFEWPADSKVSTEVRAAYEESYSKNALYRKIDSSCLQKLTSGNLADFFLGLGNYRCMGMTLATIYMAEKVSAYYSYAYNRTAEHRFSLLGLLFALRLQQLQSAEAYDETALARDCNDDLSKIKWNFSTVYEHKRYTRERLLENGNDDLVLALQRGHREEIKAVIRKWKK